MQMEGTVTNPWQEPQLCKHGQAARLALRGFAEYPSRLLCENKALLRWGRFWKVHGILATERDEAQEREKKNLKKKRQTYTVPRSTSKNPSQPHEAQEHEDRGNTSYIY